MNQAAFLSTTESAFFQARVDKVMDNAMKNIEEFLDSHVRALLVPRAKRAHFDTYKGVAQVRSPKFVAADSKTQYMNKRTAYKPVFYKAVPNAHNVPFKRPVSSYPNVVQRQKEHYYDSRAVAVLPQRYAGYTTTHHTATHEGKNEARLMKNIAKQHVYVRTHEEIPAARVISISPTQQRATPLPAKRKPQKTPLIKSTNLDLNDSMDLEQRMRRNYENRIQYVSYQQETSNKPDDDLLRKIQERRKSFEAVAAAGVQSVEAEQEMVIDPKKLRLCTNLFNLVSAGAATTSSEQILQFVSYNKLHYNCVHDLQKLARENPNVAIDLYLFTTYILKNLLTK